MLNSYILVLMTANFQEKDHGFIMYEYLKNVKQPKMPLMVMEFWTGWFDHWGEKHHIVSNERGFEFLTVFIYLSVFIINI